MTDTHARRRPKRDARKSERTSIVIDASEACAIASLDVGEIVVERGL